VKTHEDRVRDVVTALLDEVAPRGRCEVVHELAAPLPARVICEMLGFPPDLAPRCQRWSEVTMLSGGTYPVDGAPPQPGEATMTAVLEFAEAALETLAARRAEPRDDLLSVWAHAEVTFPDGTTRPMNDDEIVHEALLLLDGGAETTRTVIGTMCLELTRHADQRAQLVADPGILADTGVEEFIRWVTPILNMRRTATEDHELHGQAIRAGDELLLMYSSANRDERAFEDPDALDVTRQLNHHVAFGFGTHFCLGASLARLESRVVLEEFSRQFPRYRVDESRCVRVHMSNVHGYESVPFVAA